MGIESPVHLLFIAIVAPIVLGPKRLPALARALGQGIREFRASIETGAEPPEPTEPTEPPDPTAPTEPTELPAVTTAAAPPTSPVPTQQAPRDSDS
jgi:sec-independent protein translocase protein TatA